MENNYWRRCGSCKKEIGFNSIYQMCNVSTCSKMAFCSVDCWNQHNPVMNHKSSWAEEARSPKAETYVQPQGERRIVSTPRESTSAQVSGTTSMDHEVLIVVSKLKQYIKEKYDMNTSASVMDVLSSQVRRLTDQAAESAKRDGRKTIMDRDF